MKIKISSIHIAEVITVSIIIKDTQDALDLTVEWLVKSSSALPFRKKIP